MCGIVAAIAQRDIVDILLEGLSRLEYRGYDSAGLCVIHDNDFKRVRVTGKVSSLKEAVSKESFSGSLGIAHTRWATHGRPSVENAHPHISGDFALVHNGIIENFKEIKAKLEKEGFEFQSQTDTEVLAHLISYYAKTEPDTKKALRLALNDVEGTYGIALINKHEPDTLYTARKGSPIVIGLGFGENFVASDVLALLPVTQRFIYLDDDEIAVLKRKELKIYDQDLKPIEKTVKESELDVYSVSKGPYRHFMQKEIFEQPRAVADTFERRIEEDNVSFEAFLGTDENSFKDVDNIQIVACGTSYHAGLVGRFFLENLAKVHTEVEIASEYRYRNSITLPNSLLVTLSQSGETADTLAALRKAKNSGYKGSLAICNVPGSSLVRESDYVFLTRAGAEIGVASTKAFTTQLIALILLAIRIGRVKGTLSKEQAAEIIQEIKKLPDEISSALKTAATVEKLAEEFAGKHHCLFLGRGEMYPIALEGALKLKEISYIHAEGYAAGELKHGPIALIDASMPVVVVAPDNELIGKLKSNIEEVKARGGILYIFTSDKTAIKEDATTRVIKLKVSGQYLQSVIYTIPLQLLAYHVALINGTDVDQPRNLAKSVTVE
ncbi:glutamine--fructose-6-phosphate transaminase (isomerizing) [uncultured Succinatimonas sp.]|uniref:glutamine--fructose-6-phosphate transaminase (isomerizing) n=1 Tax=uncultured Succinatimonas sp. TaxID=1262973 RepID=UPI0025D4822C|nr:glutamine--fructose-6-phosphate transaminase (isomerizing) [uncultured Succinatimonas sp.]